MSAPKVLFLMADYGHEPTETAVPYTVFKAAGFDVSFATENGKAPECDRKLYQGVTQKFLGATGSVVDKYLKMTESEECKHPLSWTAPGFTLDPFALVFLTGGHDKSVRQIIDSPVVHGLLADYFPKARKPGKAVVGAICHGVMVLAASKGPDGKSVIHDCTTTTLPAVFESVAFWGTRPFLGDYYKTFGVDAPSTEAAVRKELDDPQNQFKNNIVPVPWVVEDDKYNYITGRFPPDASLLAEKLVKLVNSLQGQ